MKTKTYQDFDLSIERAGEHYRARVLSSPDGPTPPNEFELPFDDLRLENFILRIGQTRRTMRSIEMAGETINRSLREFGTGLYGAVFSGPVADRLHGSLGIVGQQENAGLRIRLRLSDAPELIDVPWEYLFDASAGRFLSLSVDTPVVRYLDMPGQVKPLTVQPPLRILVMISNPYADLTVEQEWKKLEDAVADLQGRGLVILERMDKPTLAELQRRLRKQDIHIFHFIGHGGFDEAAQDGVLILETEDGKARPTSGKNLGMLLHDEKSVQLAVLNACEGGRTSRQDPFAGVGQSLVQQGIPAVVAMQFEISDQAAITLAREFYAALADNYPVDAALAEARKAIFAQDNIVEWGTPVLYMRAQDGRIFDVVEVEGPEMAAARSDPHPPVTSTPLTSSPVSSPGIPSTNVPRQQTSSLAGLAGGLVTQVTATSVSLGVRIASWAALAVFIGFFLPWASDKSGVDVMRMDAFMPGILIILLTPLAVLGLRIWAARRRDAHPGFPFVFLSIISLLTLNQFLVYVFSASYGFIMVVAGSLGLLAGGITDLVLPASAGRPTALKLPPGHIVAVVGAGLSLLGLFLGIAAQKTYQTYDQTAVFSASLALLALASALVWLWALLAQRRGRLNWLDVTGNVLSTVVCGIGAVIAIEYLTLIILIAPLGAGCMLAGGVVNGFFLAGRQGAGEPGKR